MRRLVLALVLVVAACNNSSSSSRSAHITPTPAALSGDLPVFTWINDAQGQSQPAGGFLHLPGGSFHRDPRADMVKDATIPRARTPDQPYLYAYDSSIYGVPITYDRAVGRWLPVNRAQVSDDGLRYAYVDFAWVGNLQRIHLVDIRSGSDQVVYSVNNLNPQYGIVGFAQQNIYLTDCAVYNCYGSLWRLDATTGSFTKVSDRRGGWAISGQIAWMVTCYSTRAPDVCFGGRSDERGPNQLLRIDLANGSEDTWDREAGIDLIGLDNGGVPLVMVKSDSESILLRVSAPRELQRILAIHASGDFHRAIVQGAGPLVVDRFGTWLYVIDSPVGGRPPEADQGIYLYTTASGVRQISDYAGVPAGSFD